MKCTVIIDPVGEEEVILRLRDRSRISEAIEALTAEECTELMGFRAGEWTALNPWEVHLFTVEQGKVFALTDTEKWQIKTRIYLLEKILPRDFVKINQSTLANLKQIERFDTSMAGTLKVKFKNGAVDYVSRRNLKTVKERLGL